MRFAGALGEFFVWDMLEAVSCPKFTLARSSAIAESLMPPLHGSALLKGIALFLGLYTLHVVFLPLLVGERAANSDYQSLLYGLSQLLGVLTCLAPGFVTAKIARTHGFLHGGLVGGIGTILTALMAMVWAVLTGARMMGLAMLPFWLVINVFLCAFAGMLATSKAED